MTPATQAAKKAGIAFDLKSYSHDPGNPNFGEEAADKLGLTTEQVFKTLLVACEGDPKKLAVAVVPVSGTLNLKKMATALGCKKVTMADPKAAERSSGYLVGGISPLGQKRSLPTVIDHSANTQPCIWVSAGRRGLEIGLSPADLAMLTQGRFADIGRP